MIHVIKELTEAIYSILTEDPVRPHIPQLDSVGEHKDVFVYRNQDQSVAAITCVSYQNFVPVSERELFLLIVKNQQSQCSIQYGVMHQEQVVH